MIGNLRTIVVDCREPSKLAEFYSGVLGGSIYHQDDTWVVLTEPSGQRIAFQRAPEYEPPRFPDPRGSQQFHLDIRVEDIDIAERAVLELGATRVQGAVEDALFRVFRDPAGHPFCQVWGIDD